MADNVAITAGSGTNIAADERTINSATVAVQRVGEIGSTAVAVARVTPTTTAGTLIAARDTRKRLVITNNSNVTVYVGPATVTTANGYPIPVGYTLTLYTTALVQSIIATGTASADVACVEEYDS
jgi:hypothetical protein